MKTTWKEQFYTSKGNSDDFSTIEAIAPNSEILDVEFDNGFGVPEGPDFLVWTEERVYFPVVHDGAESVGSAPRHPQKNGQSHVGNW